jgi:phospholipase/carboxylesterase
MPGIADTLRFGADAQRAAVVCVFVHGRNQTPEEMVEGVLSRCSPDTSVSFVLPRAHDKCWYNALAVNPLTPESRGELARSLDDLAALIERERAAAPGKPLVLAGFSQGACLSIEHAFSGRDAPDAVLAFTGCRVGTADDARARQLPEGLPVYVSAGSADPWIPLAAFAQGVAEIGAVGAVLRTDVFPGRAHEVCNAEITMLDSVLADVAQSRSPRFGARR